MGRQDHQAGSIHVDEGHHHPFGRCPKIRLALVPHFVAIGQGGLVAMVAVGNDQFLVGHLRLHRLYDGGVGDFPQPVQHIVLVAHLDGRRATLPQSTVNLSRRVAVQHENLPAMRLRGP